MPLLVADARACCGRRRGGDEAWRKRRFERVQMEGTRDAPAARRDELGVVYANWHPGPLGHQRLADALAYQYASALRLALRSDSDLGQAPPLLSCCHGLWHGLLFELMISIY